MQRQLSPRQLANMLNVSESTIKRWVDQDLIHAEKTPGGHRRIAMDQAIRFIREQQLTPADPELLAITAQVPQSRDPIQIDEQQAGDQLYQALRNGSRQQISDMLSQWHQAGRNVPWLFDHPICNAMQRLGRLYEHGDGGIFYEHQATQLLITALHQLAAQIPDNPEGPIAIGSAMEHDPYIIPSLACALTARQAGYHDINLGPATPPQAVIAAAQLCNTPPRLIWLSLSAPTTAEQLQACIELYRKDPATSRAKIAVGGRTAMPEICPTTIQPVTTLQQWYEQLTRNKAV